MKRKLNRKAFTLVELLIVIAIIGILFVVLVSKVDFATDKAKTTGVQTDFRSFQVAFETVSRENAGFNTLGWDTGDKADNSLIAGYTYENADKDGGDRIRNSYDKGDMNLNGICEDGETWTGQKLYTETWTGVYTLDNPADADDKSAYIDLEKAINKNLDPALQISIDPENKTIYMANGYQDPWKTEYHGFYLSNAANDGKDRGAIVMYSDGPNKVFGSEQTIANGVVTVTVKNGGINGQDDLSVVTCYTYTNGYGEIGTATFGFSNNQLLSGNNSQATNTPTFIPGGPGEGGYIMLSGSSKTAVFGNDITMRSNAAFDKFIGVTIDGQQLIEGTHFTKSEGSTIITLKSSYLDTLSAKTYEIEILSTDGSAKSNLIITECKHTNGFSSGTCADCGIQCPHVNRVVTEAEWYGFGPNYTHNEFFTCSACNGDFLYEEFPCNILANGKCDTCNRCIHISTYKDYDGSADYNGHHGVMEYCRECNEMIDGYSEDCDYYNGYCQYCCIVQAHNCVKNEDFIIGYTNTNGVEINTHTVNYECTICGNTVFETKSCTVGTITYSEFDENTHVINGKCIYCNGTYYWEEDCNFVNSKCTICERDCEHLNLNPIAPYWTQHDNNTHTWHVECLDCHKDLSAVYDCFVGHTEYINNNDGTHTVNNICGDCYRTTFIRIENCISTGECQCGSWY